MVMLCLSLRKFPKMVVQGEISALHAASSKGHAGVVRILLRAGASIEATDRWAYDFSNLV